VPQNRHNTASDLMSSAQAMHALVSVAIEFVSVSG